ncbi:hypothetical protein ACUYQI_000520 [Salmonella enterica subsp. enterica serovar Braenderup]
MVIILNSISQILWFFASVFGLVSLILMFFKKKSWLRRINMDEWDSPLLAWVSFIGGMFIFGMHLVRDESGVSLNGFSVGFMISIMLIGFCLVAFLFSLISDWRKNIPES